MQLPVEIYESGLKTLRAVEDPRSENPSSGRRPSKWLFEIRGY